MTAIREVVAADHIDKITDILREAWDELGFDFELKPSAAMYRQLQDAGVLIALGAFEDDHLVGYSTAMLGPHPYNPDVIFCASDSIFVCKRYRDGLTGYRLIKETERIARSRGAVQMMWHTRTGTRMAEMCELRGYTPGDVVVERRL